MTKRTCESCGDGLSELGAFVKLSGTKFLHIACFMEQVSREAIANWKEQEAKAKAEREKIEREEAQRRARALFDGLGRCPGCGTRMTDDVTLTTLAPWQFGEVRPLSGTNPRCAVCVRQEVQARAQARGTTTPASAAQAIQTAPTRPVEAAPEAKKEEAAKPDRFSLIEME